MNAAELDMLLRLKSGEPMRNGRGEKLVCPSCKSERVFYNAAVSRNVCSKCSWMGRDDELKAVVGLPWGVEAWWWLGGVMARCERFVERFL